MAYNDSGELPVSQMYGLGEYTFELKVQTVHEPGEEDVVSVYAICREFGGSRETQAMDFPEGTTVESWSVEANETEASVYVQIGDVPDVPHASTAVAKASGPQYEPRTFTIDAGGQITIYVSGNSRSVLGASASSGATMIGTTQSSGTITTPLSSSYTLDGKTVYYGINSNANPDPIEYAIPQADSIVPNGPVAWGMVYGQPSVGGSKLVARFAIDIREADTEDWDEPGDDGPPGTTLNVTVTGATAGSCTGTPSDNLTVKGYGDGGDGGYGGGGGAGASTVIIYEFATDIAESVQQEAISRGPGTGGPGGKGGKGGDGCILIFY